MFSYQGWFSEVSQNNPAQTVIGLMSWKFKFQTHLIITKNNIKHGKISTRF